MDRSVPIRWLLNHHRTPNHGGLDSFWLPGFLIEAHRPPNEAWPRPHLRQPRHRAPFPGRSRSFRFQRGTDAGKHTLWLIEAMRQRPPLSMPQRLKTCSQLTGLQRPVRRPAEPLRARYDSMLPDPTESTSERWTHGAVDFSESGKVEKWKSREACRRADEGATAPRSSAQDAGPLISMVHKFGKPLYWPEQVAWPVQSNPRKRRP